LATGKVIEMEPAMTALVLERRHRELVVQLPMAGSEGNEFCLPHRRAGL
jgi:hypothetical protein